jgi:COMPASS component SWD2
MNETEENFLNQFYESKTIHEQSPIRLLEFSPNGEHFSYVVNDSLKIYVSSTSLPGNACSLKNIITAPMDTMAYFTNYTLIHSNDNNMFYLSIFDNRYLRTFEGHTDKIQSITVNGLQDMFMSSGKDSIKLWDIRYKDPILSFDSKGRMGCISRDNDFAIADNNFIYIYDHRHYSTPKEVKAIKPNFYKKMWYTQDSSLICMTNYKSHLFLDNQGNFVTSLNLENESDGCCLFDSNVFLFGSSKNILAHKIQDKKRIGRLVSDNLEVSFVRSNPQHFQFIAGSENSFKVFNRNQMNDRSD